MSEAPDPLKFGDVIRQDLLSGGRRYLMFLHDRSEFTDSGVWMVISETSPVALYPDGYIGSWPMTDRDGNTLPTESDD